MKTIRTLFFSNENTKTYCKGGLNKFTGSENRRKLLQVIIKNPAIEGNQDAADFIINESELVGYERGENLIEQGGLDDDVYFLIHGNVRIIIDEEDYGLRRAPNTVGEMAAMSPNDDRSATVKSLSRCVVASKLSSNKLEQLFKKYPDIKDRMYDERGRRHRQLIEHVKEKVPEKVSKTYNLVALIACISLMVIVFLTFPFSSTLVKVVVALFVAAFTYPILRMRTPQYRYYRILAPLILSGSFVAMSGLKIEFDGKIFGSDGIFSFVNDVPPSFYYYLAVAILVLGFLEYKVNTKR